jgi:hypothetical protein
LPLVRNFREGAFDGICSMFELPPKDGVIGRQLVDIIAGKTRPTEKQGNGQQRRRHNALMP